MDEKLKSENMQKWGWGEVTRVLLLLLIIALLREYPSSNFQNFLPCGTGALTPITKILRTPLVLLTVVKTGDQQA